VSESLNPTQPHIQSHCLCELLSVMFFWCNYHLHDL